MDKHRNYKLKEAEHYNSSAQNIADVIGKFHEMKKYSDVGLFRAPHKFWHQTIQKNTENISAGIHVLDYGCGTGVHSVELASQHILLTGIDISSGSIEMANKLKHETGSTANYHVMDCENTDFDDHTFDIIIDYGTFSSLDINAALPEILRILKPDGCLIAIETYGHNPLTNFKRWFNVILKKRTKWAAGHIMRNNDWQKFISSFQQHEIHYFSFWVLFISPFTKLLPQKLYLSLLTIAENMDRVMFKKSIFRKLAFKIVVILNNEKKNI
jgi:ubiquinone/menaquinone biosynthesis C-methylase UbiE